VRWFGFGFLNETSCQGQLLKLETVRWIAGLVAALARPRLHRGKLQSETAVALEALLPSILDKAFKGEL
jgi:hypothetical protein